MDFGLMPPEVNSGRMYAGPGSGPLLAAASAWRGLAADMELAANGHRSVLAELTADWRGPSAGRMATAAEPYVAWLHRTAAIAEHTADQTYAAAAAFEAAFAKTVPPPVIAANRSELLVLTATNFFGQNSPAIAANEAAYAAMWAQDAAAMYHYAGDAAVATAVKSPSEPPRAVNPAESIANAASSAGGSSGAGPPAVGGLPTSGLIEVGLIPLHIGLDLFGAFVIDGLGAFALDPIGVGIGMLGSGGVAAGQIPSLLVSATTPGAAAVSAGMAEAVPLSGLSVPSAWTVAADAGQPSVAVRPAVTVRAATSVSPAATQARDEHAMASMAGLGAMAGLNGQRRGPAAGSGRRLGVPSQQLDPELEAAAELRELINLRDSGVLTDEEFATEKERLFAE